MDRYAWARKTASLDPIDDAERIYRILASHEFPWDFNQSLGFALFRTYAVPSIGRLLYETGEFTERTQKRYDDTGLLLDAVLEHGFGSDIGKAAVRRINRMHGMYDISNDDLRYVLCTFVTVPERWLDRFGWRPLTASERLAAATYYQRLGRHMGIRNLPATADEFAVALDEYEAEHFAYDEGGRAVADATLDLMATFPPNHHAPVALVRRFSYALMDEPLLDAFRYARPTRAEQVAAAAALKARARVERYLPARREPLFARQLPQIRSYPNGYDVSELGTFTPGCPVPHARGAGASPLSDLSGSTA
jgi:hypothetical protein